MNGQIKEVKRAKMVKIKLSPENAKKIITKISEIGPDGKEYNVIYKTGQTDQETTQDN